MTPYYFERPERIVVIHCFGLGLYEKSNEKGYECQINFHIQRGIDS